MPRGSRIKTFGSGTLQNNFRQRSISRFRQMRKTLLDILGNVGVKIRALIQLLK